MSNPIRILHVLNGLGSGGAEAAVMNWYRNIDRNKVQFDFLVRSEDNLYADEIAEYGGRVFIMPPYPSRYFDNKRMTNRFFKNYGKEFSGIHVHGNALLYVNVFKIAKKYGINFRIYHSHSTFTNTMYIPLHIINRFRIKKLATDYFACSRDAGEWAFGSGNYTVIKNGVDSDRFVYNEIIRKNVRTCLGITDQIVYGHVGRFVPVKNHNFLLEVFEKILKHDENSLLMLVGDGELLESVKSSAEEKGILQKILFLGRQSNISDLMNAMDVFLFPSFHEGLAIATIEAQASGLPCLLSNRVSCETKITDNVLFLPLSDFDSWVARAIGMRSVAREITQVRIKSAGYDIFSISKYLERFYCSHIAEKERR